MMDKSSISGTKTTDYCALVISQDSTDEVKRNPSIPKGRKLCGRLTEILPCQKTTPWFKTKDRPRLPDNMQLSSKADDNELVNADKTAIYNECK